MARGRGEVRCFEADVVDEGSGEVVDELRELRLVCELPGGGWLYVDFEDGELLYGATPEDAYAAHVERVLQRARRGAEEELGRAEELRRRGDEERARYSEVRAAEYREWERELAGLLRGLESGRIRVRPLAP